MSKWYRELKERKSSLSCEVNLLWQHDTIYIMDNHRVALWCWAQNVDLAQPIRLLHIDRHYDTLEVDIDKLISLLPDLDGIDLDDYLNLTYDLNDHPCTLIRYDNYLSLCFAKFGTSFSDIYMATHEDDDEPTIVDFKTIKHSDALSFDLLGLLMSDGPPWIVNLDLDYFINKHDEKYNFPVPEEAIAHIARQLKSAYDQNKIAVLTIALSPENTGNWELAEHFCSIVSEELGLDFHLPE